MTILYEPSTHVVQFNNWRVQYSSCSGLLCKLVYTSYHIIIELTRFPFCRTVFYTTPMHQLISLCAAATDILTPFYPRRRRHFAKGHQVATTSTTYSQRTSNLKPYSAREFRWQRTGTSLSKFRNSRY